MIDFIHDNLVLYDKTKQPEILRILKSFLKLIDLPEIEEVYSPTDDFYHHSAMVYHELFLEQKLSAISKDNELRFKLKMLNKVYNREMSKSIKKKEEIEIKKTVKENFKIINSNAVYYKEKYLSCYKNIKSDGLKRILRSYFKAEIPFIIENFIKESEKKYKILPEDFEDNFEIRHLTDKHIVKSFINSYRELQIKIEAIDSITDLMNKKAP